MSLRTARSSQMDFVEIRRTAIVALFSDDTLFELLVLKGGNALALVYGLGNRASLDVDMSIDGDFKDLDDARRRIFTALEHRFQRVGYRVFDQKFEPRPAVPGEDETRAGYVVEFKLIESARYDDLNGDLDAIRKNSLVTGPLQKRTFRIELSKHEFCRNKQEVELDEYAVYVYTTDMLAIEKLRALCQQLPEYKGRTSKTARARDFYDIYVLVREAGVSLSAPHNADLIRSIFSAKKVPLSLISRIPTTAEFHRPDWPSVQDSTKGALEDFDFYFEFLVQEIKSLEPLWIE
jgi:hypothetical protein